MHIVITIKSKIRIKGATIKNTIPTCFSSANINKDIIFYNIIILYYIIFYYKIKYSNIIIYIFYNI